MTASSEVIGGARTSSEVITSGGPQLPWTDAIAGRPSESRISSPALKFSEGAAVADSLSDRPGQGRRMRGKGREGGRGRKEGRAGEEGKLQRKSVGQQESGRGRESGRTGGRERLEVESSKARWGGMERGRGGGGLRKEKRGAVNCTVPIQHWRRGKKLKRKSP